MNTTITFLKISMIVKNLFDKQSSTEIAAMKQHFQAVYSSAQLFALVFVGMVIRVFGLVPEPAQASRSIWSVVGLFVQFLKSLGDQPEMIRALPNPLDGLVQEGLDELTHLETTIAA